MTYYCRTVSKYTKNYDENKLLRMSKFKLLPYRIRVRKKYDDEFLNLSQLPDGKGDTKSISTVLDKFLSHYLNNVYEYPAKEKTLFTENPSKIVNNDTIHGLVWAGNWGI